MRPLNPLTYHPSKMGAVELAKPAAVRISQMRAAAQRLALVS